MSFMCWAKKENLCGKTCRSRPFGPPSFWRTEVTQINGDIRPSSRPQAMEGSPEGRVPLALSAEDRPPRRRINGKLQRSRV